MGLMLTASSMELINILVLKEKADEVVSYLLKKGIFHPVDVRQVEEQVKGLLPYQVDKEYTGWEILDARMRDLQRWLGNTIEPARELEHNTAESIRNLLVEIEQKVQPFVNQKEEISAVLKTKEEMLAQVKDFLPLPARKSSLYSFLETAYGRVDEKNLGVLERSLAEIPQITYPYKKEEYGQITTLIICLRRDRAVLDKVLKDIGWVKMEAPQNSPLLSKEVQEKLRNEIKKYQVDLVSINTQLGLVAEKYRERLSKVIFFVLVKKALLEARKYAYATEKTVLLTGWIPSADREKVLAEIKGIDQASYIEETAAEKVNIPREDIPVQLIHNAFLKPFSLLIDSYGLPRYGTIDPTIFVAFSFLLMFGVMFGDVGQGLVLLLASLFLRRSKTETVRQAGTLILYCGISSAIFGILYGSVFGIESRAIWIRPIDHILEIFADTVVFGVIVISVGIAINIINALRDKNYLKVFFDKAGLIAGIVYWTGIAVAIKLFISKGPISPLLFYILAGGMAALFLKPLLEVFLKKKKESFFMAIIESGMEVVEIIMGYLANTISFIRVGAFALSHAGLFIAIFSLSDLLKNVGHGSASIMIIVSGNIGVILLEGMIVTIQSVRLNYYEFFSKFFVSGNKVYKPLTL